MDFNQINSALQSADEEVRRAALNSLRHSADPEVNTFIFTAMGDESWRVRKEAVECYVSTNPDLSSVGQLLDLIRNEENAGLRNSAAEAVVRLGSFSAPLLNGMILDSDADVRKFVIDIMGAIGEKSFAPALINALHDQDMNVAAAAAEQLGNLGDSSAAEPLMQAVADREDVLFRFSALGTLSLIAKPAPVPRVLLELADQEILKKAVFECLGNIADASSYKLLLNAFSAGQKNCRAAAVKALYKIFRRSPAAEQAEIYDALQLLKENGIVAGLIELFDQRDANLTEALVWVSIVTRDARFIPMLIDAYTDERTAVLALAALKSFGREALQEIVSRYAHLEDSGKSGLCILIAECGYSGFNDVIQKALLDNSSHVRKAAAGAVGKLGLISLIADLVKLIDDNDQQVYNTAVASLQSLIMIDRSAIMTQVEQFCTSKLSHHRKAAALLLASLGDRDRLILLIKDEDAQVRKAAVSAVGTCRFTASVPMLVLALTDEDPDVRIMVADVLGMLRDASALGALEHAMEDTDVWVQASVLKAIAAIDSQRAKNIIASIHCTAEGLLMITALQLLESIGGTDAEQMIRSAMNNSDPDISRQAVRSLERVTATKRTSGCP